MDAAAAFSKSCDVTLDTSNAEAMWDDASFPPIEIAREDQIKETYNQGMKLLKELKKAVPATTAKVERTKEVATTVYS